jgi:hypothetical protein
VFQEAGISCPSFGLCIWTIAQIKSAKEAQDVVCIMKLILFGHTGANIVGK